MYIKHILMIFLMLTAIVSATPRQIARAADAVVGDGSPGSCTEAAFDIALATANNGGVISFNCGTAVHTIDLTVSKVIQLSNMTINGGGRIVLDAGPNERHFFVGPITFRLQHITLQGGDSLVSGGAIESSGAQLILEHVQLRNNRASVSGGAIYCFAGVLAIHNSVIVNNQAETGGAIYNDGCRLEITDTSFADNRASGATGRGGAVENATAGVLTARNISFRTNYALDGGGLYNAIGADADLLRVSFTENTAGYGGGIENSGVLTVTNSLFVGNEATGSGGGIWNLNGAAMIAQTTFSDNFAYEGGGVNSYGSVLDMREVNVVSNYANGMSGTPNGGGLYHAGGVALIADSTIQGNYAANNGGGIYQASDDNLTLTNVTIAGNIATGLGGGLYHYGRYAVLTNVTLASNQAGIAGHAIYEDSPQTPAHPGVVQLANSVIFGSAVTCDGQMFQSLGHNLSQGNCASLNDPTDQNGFTNDLMIGDLALNGGRFPMQTLLPQPGSPLINAGDPMYCRATDQRGASRVGICDLGAVEYGAVAFAAYLPLIRR